MNQSIDLGSGAICGLLIATCMAAQQVPLRTQPPTEVFYATPEQAAEATKVYLATPEQAAEATKVYLATPEQAAESLGFQGQWTPQVHEITISGDAALLGRPITPLAPNAWLIEQGDSFAIGVMVSDTRIEVYGASGMSAIDAEGMSPPDALVALADGASDVGPSMNCGAGEHYCECTVPAAAGCNGIQMTSYRCCPDSTVCACTAVRLTPGGCVVGVRARCDPHGPGAP